MTADWHFLPAQQSTQAPLSLASCIIRLTGAESAAATQTILLLAAMFPKPMSMNSAMSCSLYQVLNLFPHLFDNVLAEKNVVRNLNIVSLAACGVYFAVDLLDKEIHLLADSAVT